MTIHKKILSTAIIFITMLGTAGFLTILPQDARACGYGMSGGSDYIPQQRRNSAGFLANKNALTPEQAREIVSGHVRKLNPNLEVGNVNDAGGFYEAEVVSKDKEVVQLLGVDKYSGRLMVLE